MTRTVPRSLKAALSEAGFGEPPADSEHPEAESAESESAEKESQQDERTARAPPHRPVPKFLREPDRLRRERSARIEDVAQTESNKSERAPETAAERAISSGPGRAVGLLDHPPTPPPLPVHPHATADAPRKSAIPPPPWVRAARRARRRRRLMNIFGWLMTLVVAGAIIGLAARYLAVPPPGLETLKTRP